MTAKSEPDKLAIIRKAFIFSGLSDEALRKLVNIALPKKIPKNDLLFLRGQKAEGFYLLGSGQVQLFVTDFQGRERAFKIIPPGEVFGEAALFQKNGYQATARAEKPTEVLFWPKLEIIELLKSDGELALGMIGLLAHKLEHFASLIRQSLKEIVPRVAEFLLAWPHKEETLIDPPKKAIMAKALGVTPESVSRALGRLKKANLVSERPRLAIVDREGLKLIASGEWPLDPPKNI